MEQQIRKTKNYSLFELLEHNRDIKPNPALRSSMVRHGFLPDQAILVRSINGSSKKFYVIDGQNRLTNAKELGIEVYYKVTTDVTDDMIADLQTGKPWLPKDYMKHYFTKGKPGYEIVKAISEKYPRVKNTVVVNLLSGTIANGGSDATEDFKRGKLKIVSEAQARMTLEYCQDLCVKFNAPWVFTRAFVNSMARMVASGRYDHKRLLSKLEYLSEKFHKLHSPDAYFEMLKEIYNFKSRTGMELFELPKRKRVKEL